MNEDFAINHELAVLGALGTIYHRMLAPDE